MTASRAGKEMIYRLTDQRIITVLGLLGQVGESNLAEWKAAGLPVA